MAGWFTPVKQYSIVSVVVVLVALWAVNVISENVERGSVVSRLEQEAQQPARVGSYRVVEELSALAPPDSASFLSLPSDGSITDRLVLNAFAGQSVIRVDIARRDGLIAYSTDHTTQGTLLLPSASSATQGATVSTYMGTEAMSSISGDTTPRETVVTKVPIYREGAASPSETPEFTFVVYRDVTEAIDAATSSGTTFRVLTVLAVMGVLFASLLVVVMRGHSIAAAARRQLAALLAKEQALSTELDERNLALEEAVNAKVRLLSVVTHELNNPLTSISAYSEILGRNRSGGLGERELTAASAINRNARRMSALVGDLLDYSRIESNSIVLELEEYEIGALIDEVVESMLPVLGERGQRLEVKANCGQALVAMDRTRCEQVLVNLISNASKYSPEGSIVSVSCGRSAGGVQIEVADQGIGISEDDQARLFTPFFRADNEETRAVKGTGLGLLISKQIAELHGGSLTISSRRGSGTRVCLSLPSGGPPG